MKPRTLILIATCSLALPLLTFAQRDNRGGSHVIVSGGSHGGGFSRGPSAASHPAVVERSNHGSLRHQETHVVHAPEVRHEEHHEEPNHVIVGGGRHYVHHDVDVDVHAHHYWNDFARGRRFDRLPAGFLHFNIGGLPYFYFGGIYYQSAPGGYEEVYPPVGAVLPEPPEGAFEVIDPNGVIYYYAGGAFYQQTPQGFALVAPPVGVIVPELPPGAVQVSVNGIIAYQFAGMYYQPVFVNGVTQYQTFLP